MRVPAVLLWIFFVAAAGCLSNPTYPEQTLPVASAGPVIDRFPVELNHNHADSGGHNAALGLESVAHLRTSLRGAQDLPPFNLAVAGDILAASLGSPGTSSLAPPMSLLLADVKDPAKPRLLSITPAPGGGVESVALSPDAKFAFLGTEFAGAVGIWTFDITNPSTPRIVAYTPLPTEGPHNIRYGVIGTRHFLFASISHVATALSPLGQDPIPVYDLRVDLLEFQPGQPQLPMRLVSSYQARDTDGDKVRNTPIVHDAILQVHPITQQALLYVAHWDRGVRIVDVTAPDQPKEIGKYFDMPPTDFLIIHTVKPHPGLIEGRHYTVATSQCAYAATSKCYVRILDTTDPNAPVQVGVWTLPEEVHGGIYTTEIFDLADGKIYVPWKHAGTWMLDIGSAAKAAKPVALGYHFVDTAPTIPGSGVYVPNANAVILKDGYAILADVWTGIHVLGQTPIT